MTQITGQLRDYALVIAAGSSEEVKASGNYFRILDADGGQIRVSTDAGDKFRAKEGEGARIAPFTKIRFENTDAVDRRVVVLVGVGQFESARLTGQVSLLPAGSLVAVGDVAGGGSIPANSGRQRLIMRAAIANAGAVSVAGIPLQPGDTWELDITGGAAVSGAATDILHVAEVV